MINAITWFEIPAKNHERAVNFYSTILDKTLRRGDFNGVPHGFFPADEAGVAGAVVLNPDYETSTQGVVIYLNAGHDIEGIVGRVAAAGGKVLLPVTDIAPQGKMALLQDSEGNRVGLHQAPQA
jgi:uncharacterized protein